MRRLIVMRHAKSSWAEAGQRDHERPLNERGRRDAPRIGDWLAERGYFPDAALVSTAARTQETWARLGAALAQVAMTPRADFYAASPDVLRKALRAAPDVGCLLVLGHQPTIGAFARQTLDDPPDDPAFAKYPTAATSVIDLDIPDWRAFGERVGRLADFVHPGGIG